VLDQLDRELIGLKPVKTRIREIASLLLIERIRKRMNLTSEVPTLHMSFPAIPAPARPRWRCGSQHPSQARFRAPRQVVSVTRDELVGQYIGHTAPKTKNPEKGDGGCCLSTRPTTAPPRQRTDYGRSIEILLQVMESQPRLVVILPVRRPDGQVLRQQSRIPLPHRPHIDFSGLFRRQFVAIRN